MVAGNISGIGSLINGLVTITSLGNYQGRAIIIDKQDRLFTVPYENRLMKLDILAKVA
jgi:hypothetical protein